MDFLVPRIKTGKVTLNFVLHLLDVVSTAREYQKIISKVRDQINQDFNVKINKNNDYLFKSYDFFDMPFLHDQESVPEDNVEYYAKKNDQYNADEELCKVCHRGHINCFKYLLLNGAELKNVHLFYAIIGGNNEIIRTISDQITDFKIFIELAMNVNRNDLADWFIERTSKKFNIKCASPLYCCNFKAFQYLYLKNKSLFSTNLLKWYSYEVNPLSIAAGLFQSIDILNEFSTYKDFTANHPNHEIIKPILPDAVLLGNMEIVRWLVEHGAKSNKSLKAALKSKNYDILKYLVSKSFNINYIKPDKGEPSVSAIAIEDHPIEIIKFLLENGADPNYNKDMIIAAAQRGDIEIFKLLIQYGAKYDITWFHFKAYYAQILIIQFNIIIHDQIHYQ
ncbi:hypothetical protein TVAG_446770 [Trichomonas vaginalis G3]|uniref:Uncharacterized protein n=1 Tax=Trichomonas vaginalis (strain ATCC PRA-98 / G3) TaxID=412133 RepID=A2E8N6_TRIV3|nr:Ankyrin repeat family [Trichomonas vaginalis G3]EAY10975.1 hypothetical protein TVAG_446770 [Trichomonas vaginalis G3]KAI5530824.1 Ankyrin repeat family [Trichomonas vaginalis G3]|eukprot:XP_001323198.1 hypothetical protein [Trichomonas vaginalis G3]